MRIIYMVISCLLATSSVFADTYAIYLETQFNREAPEMTRLVAKAGEVVEHITDKIALKLSPTKVSEDVVKVETEISHRSKRGVKLVAKPQIISYLDCPAEFFQESHDGSSDVRLTVVARKVE
jgi:hypothetical protein